MNCNKLLLLLERAKDNDEMKYLWSQTEKKNNNNCETKQCDLKEINVAT